ncbi:hypothetical protein CXF85_22035 [Colwellia sp. 75C3]|uniref:DUF1439 domain-containing protein n=1 Tax=Colwellia sp. 75C3 TaxID=888425 RepID=UPI000C3265B6|nr:DUF1439 domain-containing protein [Colwellia sp. 75C3]PKG80791.1 hypothetical protein CXF85_22035 [Colwellia sp. 75C3]
MYKIIATVILTFLLSACSSLQISENDINDKVKDWIGQGKKISLGKSALLPVLMLKNAQFSLIPERVKLNIKASVEMNNFLGRRTLASGFIAMSGVPYLDNESGKIYIKQYSIEHIEMMTPDGQAWSVKGAMFDSVKDNIVNYVDNIPIYDINKDEKLSGVILSQVKTIELKQGHINLVM